MTTMKPKRSVNFARGPSEEPGLRAIEEDENALLPEFSAPRVEDDHQTAKDADEPSPGLDFNSRRRHSCMPMVIKRPESASSALLSGAARRERRGSVMPMNSRHKHQNPVIDLFTTENFIFTPFAQILASLRKVRLLYIKLTGTISKNPNAFNTTVPICSVPEADLVAGTDEYQNLAGETLEELEWCLQQLETIQTKRPVSNMASTKFKRLLNRELNSPRNSDKTKHQISEYISRTFLDHESEEEEEETQENPSKPSDATTLVPNQQQQQQVSTKMPSTMPNMIRSIQSAPEPVVALTTDPAAGDANGPLFSAKYSDQVEEFLTTYLDYWGMNIFELASLTNGAPLVPITLRVFQTRSLIKKLNLDPQVVLNYLVKLESSYDSTVPYHNSIHAADVTQSTHVLLQAENLEGVFSDLEVFSVLFACAIHDVSHPGVTNQFLVNTNHELAICYNDVSVLENFHLTVAFRLLTEPGCDLLQRLTAKQRQCLRRTVIDLVLATDMSKHMNLLADLKTMVETKKIAGSGVLNLDNYTDRIQILQNMIHCADLSNPTKPWEVYELWTKRIMEEFFLQGDRERALNLEISPMCDRTSVAIEKSQISFIDFIVHPLWETWCDLVPLSTANILDKLEENRDVYQNQIGGSLEDEDEESS